jgi:hypothetical protein
MFKALRHTPLQVLFPLNGRLHGWFINSTEKV